ncbi:DUF3737 family protein [Celerinatantimonas sp. YJH-8]|uniref:DUF3737 family protein n=1 Tax=Celerinatantimonas sp. YJH-8 TaxID=3228714 RepID=UPI0038C00D41
MQELEKPLKVIKDRFFEGERPLFGITDTTIENVKFYPGESALKHTKNIVSRQCEYMCKYPFWHGDHIVMSDSIFTTYARAAIWYSKNLYMKDCLVDAPKMFRRVSDLTVENSRFTHAEETLWNCDHVTLRDVELENADYVFMNGEDIDIENMTLQGNYSFQDGKNITIRNSHLKSKDALWGTENVTVYDSVLEGEYLAWHSKNLRLVNCTIRGEQPLYYSTNLVLENCRMEETDLCFEYSDVKADIVSDIISVRNPKSGYIRAQNIGEIIIDEHCINPGKCQIEVLAKATV